MALEGRACRFSSLPFPHTIYLHISVCPSAHHLPIRGAQLMQEGEKRIGKKLKHIWTWLVGFLAYYAVSPYCHEILLQTPETLGLFQQRRNFPELDNDTENFKTLVPI